MDTALLAAEKVKLEQRLMAIGMMNVYGKKLDDLIALETDKIETMKKLSAVERAINTYVQTEDQP